MCMPEPLMPKIGLGMNVAYRPCRLRDRLQRELEGHRVVGGLQAVGVLEVDLVLTVRDLVVGRLDADAEGLERVDHVAADGLREVGVKSK